jgi:sugar phosphate isomerase/epimerase
VVIARDRPFHHPQQEYYGGKALTENSSMQIALNGNNTMPYPFLLDVRVAVETGYDGLIVVGDKLRRYLAQGFSIEQANSALAGIAVLGMNNVRDIERSSEPGRSQLLAECEDACRLAQAIGGSSIQLLTGPLDPGGTYRDPLLMEPAELDRVTISNLRQIGAIGQRFGVGFYIEPLAWTPLADVSRVVRILGEADQKNIGLAIDFWHLWSTGTEPDKIARLDGSLIRSVDICDGLGRPGESASPDQRSRRVWTGAGSIPLKAWVDAVRATGYDGTWSCELLSPQHWELDPWATNRDLRQLVQYLFL